MTRSSLKLIGSIAVGNALVPLNSTMIVVALPFIARDAHTDLASASWLITSYLIAMAALQPIGGRLGDRFGRRRLMLGALLYFGVASVGAALSPNLVLLTLFRVQQAVAAALVSPNGLGILRRAAGPRAGMFFGLISAISGGAASIGPLLGGLLVAIDWRLCFLVNVPLAAIAFGLAFVNVPDETSSPSTRFDLTGVVALGALLTGAAWLLTSLAHGVNATLVLIGVALAVGAVAFARHESAHEDPALPLSLFRIRAFASANGSIGAANFTLYGTLLAIPAFLASDPESAVRVGIALFALGAAQFTLGPVTGLLIDRFGARWPTLAGGILIAAGSIATGVAVQGGLFALLVVSLLVTGAGISATFPATRVAAIDAVPQRFVALASGVVQTSRSFAAMLGAIAVGIAFTTVPADVRTPVLFALLAAGGALTSVVSLGMPGVPPARDIVSSEVA